MSKEPTLDYPIHDLIAERWSPVCFSDQIVPKEDLCALFEAARWAPSSYNEQPWHYIVATADDKPALQTALGCLREANQAWAKYAPVLVFAVFSETFIRNNKANRAAQHDLGLAAGNICVEATARGLKVHQMIGIEPDKVRAEYGIPEGYTPLTALAIGYPGELTKCPKELRERDQNPRVRKPISEFVFAHFWGEKSKIVA